MDLFVVPTVSFRLLYGLLIMGHGRRQILWLGVTAHPTAEWIANQLTAACGWEQLPRYLIRRPPTANSSFGLSNKTRPRRYRRGRACMFTSLAFFVWRSEMIARRYCEPSPRMS